MVDSPSQQAFYRVLAWRELLFFRAGVLGCHFGSKGAGMVQKIKLARIGHLCRYAFVNCYFDPPPPIVFSGRGFFHRACKGHRARRV